MEKLVSEQLPNDGGYHVKRLVNEANARLKQIGKQGKRATIVAKTSSLTLQFTFHDGSGNSQKNVGLGAIPLSPNGILEAEKIARLVTAQLVAGAFTWDWFNSLIGKHTSERNKQLTCKEMVEQFKEHFFKQRKDNTSPEKSWYLRCSALEDVLSTLNKPLSLSLIRQVIETKANNSTARGVTINGLVEFLKYHRNSDYKEVIKDYRANNKPKRKKSSVPNDATIIEVHKTGFVPKAKSNKRYQYRFPQWQFLFGLLATYGLRIHEAWHIANWDKPVTLKDGDWVIVNIDDETEESKQHSGKDLFVPAILDPNNEKHILCIKHDTKTGYRMAMPLSAEGHNWIEEFNLLQPLNLPDIKNPLSKGKKKEASFICSTVAARWFRRGNFSFTPHALRHAYNHRGHRTGISIGNLCQSLGHSIQMNTTTYTNSKSDSVKLQEMKDAISKEQKKRTKIELLREENKAFESELQAAQKEIELLKAKLKMYEAIEESKKQK